MGTDAKGPIFAAGTEVITKDGFEILFMPDVNNDALQREGKAPVYHWVPNSVRLAQKANGDYKFNMVHFVGVRSQGTTVGAQGTEEVAGGLVGFSTTSAPPAATMAAAQQQLLDRFRGSDQSFWGWRVPVAPMFRPAPIVSSVTSITNLGPVGSKGIPGITGARALNGAPNIGLVKSRSSLDQRGTYPLSRAYRDSNLDMWYVNLQGQGPGAISPVAENAYSGLCGSIPAALMWASFHGGQSPIGVWQNQRIKVWAPLVEISIHGEWSKVQEHFSAAAHAGGLFWGADIQAEFNNLRLSGGIEVRISIDPTIPGGEKIQESIDKRSDMIFNKFMEEAQKVIFDPPSFNEKPAEAKGGFLGFGGGAAFKLRKDTVNLTLDYHEKREICYLQENQVSGQLDGLYDVLKADPSAEKKYFTNLYLDDWDRKVSRLVKPVVNWPEPARKWVGEPVSFLSVQVGYPDSQGAIQWDGHVFEPAGGTDAKWNTAMAKKNQSDVKNAPAGWAPDKTFLKRKIHFSEAPSELENPYVRVSVERNEVDLDEGPNGSLVDDNNIEVRVDNVGTLNVGPIFLGVDLEGPKQIVEVTFKAAGKTLDGKERTPVKFSWSASNQEEPRLWMIFTGQPDFSPKYSYQVRVLTKGSILTHGMEWVGPWVEAGGNGQLMVRVPALEDEGVTIISRSIAPRNSVFAVGASPGPSPTPQAPVPAGAPPHQGAAPAGKPPARGITTLGKGSPPTGGNDAGRPAVDDPFAIPGFAPREVLRVDRQIVYTGGDSGSVRPATGKAAQPAGSPPKGSSVAPRGVVVGGYTIEDDGPAR